MKTLTTEQIYWLSLLGIAASAMAIGYFIGYARGWHRGYNDGYDDAVEELKRPDDQLHPDEDFFEGKWSVEPGSIIKSNQTITHHSSLPSAKEAA